MRDVNWYLSRGFDRRMAEYFASGTRQITAVRPGADYTLILDFDNGETRVFSCKPLLKPGTVFEPLLDEKRFRSVYLDETHCVCWDRDPAVDSNTVWNNKVDLCPDVCYVDSLPIE